MTKKACSDCAHWDWTHKSAEGVGEDAGKCSRRAPSAVTPDDAFFSNYGIWPITRRDDWCGDFERRA
jgi:hypothetical protein